MKEKIKQLANGAFEYELPEIVLSQEAIAFEIEAGTDYTGSFVIKNQKNSSIKGIVYSSQRRMQIIEPIFSGKKNTISYQLDAKNISPGETIRGVFTVVSNCGEVEIPFAATVLLPYCTTSIGKIHDLFHFADLARSDWLEAVKLFKSEDFKRVFLSHDLKNTIIYENLIKGISASQALEEFLVKIHKKLRINLSVDHTKRVYQVEKESFMDKLIINKDNWGYTEIRISTDVPFLIPDHKILWSDNFIGNTYTLEYVINPEYMRNGKNFGHIFLKTAHQTFVIEVQANCIKEKKIAYPGQNQESNQSLKKHQCQIKLVQNYLLFRSNKMKAEQYVEDTQSILTNLTALEDTPILALIKIHLCMVDGKFEQSEELLEEFIAHYDKLEETKIPEYSGYLYLKALLTKEDSVVEDAIERIQGYYNQGFQDFRMLWFLLYLDKKYSKNRKKKLEDIMFQFKRGCHSPILYYEAMSIFNDDPVLLQELNPITIQIINWGIKYQEIQREAIRQYTYLASKQKIFQPLIYKGLVRLYERYKTKDILSAICCLLIKGQKTGEMYFKWYSLGVEAQLRITELHEYYMYSVSEDTEIELPQPLLHYFIYNSKLNDKKKAYLYANVIKNKEKNPTAYSSYLSLIEQFAIHQIQLRNINENLAILYEAVLKKEMVTEEVAKNLPYIMFRHELYCDNPNIVGVYVIHKELQTPKYIPIENGKAQFNLFTESPCLFLADEKDNRYICTVEYTLKKLLHLDDYAGICYEFHKQNDMLILNLMEQIENYHKFDDNIIAIRQHVLKLEDLREYYQSRGKIGLIRYYYDNFETEKLEELLKQVNLALFTSGERNQIMEYTIIRGLNEKAFEEMVQYGYEEVNIKRLLRLFSSCLEEDYLSVNVPQRWAVELGYFIFQSGKYDEKLLYYLIKYYDGITRDMYELWKACKGFELETELLEERLLAQLLFTEMGGIPCFSIFSSYYNKNNGDKKLIRAYISYYSYKYLIHDRVLEDEFFEIIRKESIYEENDTAMLALLKYDSMQKELSEIELKLIDYNIHKYMEKGIILPFFKDLKGKISIPSNISNKYFAEYRTEPSHKVTIYYLLENEEEQENFIQEPMKQVYPGIFVKDFVLFYGENLQYYIVEEDDQEERITESITITLENQPEEEEDKYSAINLMLMTKEMQDEKALFEMMEHYIENEYAAIELFKPL